jgi:predicted hotdog family 3-hydroxylacyl-ACP dehydratase
VEVEPTDLVDDIKAKVMETIGTIPATGQMLLVNDVILSGDDVVRVAAFIKR